MGIRTCVPVYFMVSVFSRAHCRRLRHGHEPKPKDLVNKETVPLDLKSRVNYPEKPPLTQGFNVGLRKFEAGCAWAASLPLIPTGQSFAARAS